MKKYMLIVMLNYDDSTFKVYMNNGSPGFVNAGTGRVCFPEDGFSGFG